MTGKKKGFLQEPPRSENLFFRNLNWAFFYRRNWRNANGIAKKMERDPRDVTLRRRDASGRSAAPNCFLTPPPSRRELVIRWMIPARNHFFAPSEPFSGARAGGACGTCKKVSISVGIFSSSPGTNLAPRTRMCTGVGRRAGNAATEGGEYLRTRTRRDSLPSEQAWDRALSCLPSSRGTFCWHLKFHKISLRTFVPWIFYSAWRKTKYRKFQNGRPSH